jgi:hypothetical protein
MEVDPLTHERTADDISPIIASFDTSVTAQHCVTDLKAAGFAEGAIRFISEAEKARLTSLGVSDASSSMSGSDPPDPAPHAVIAAALPGGPLLSAEPESERHLVEPVSGQVGQDFRAGKMMLQISAGARKSEAAEIVRRTGGNIESPLITGLFLGEAERNPDV